jgi:hypothetical protein
LQDQVLDGAQILAVKRLPRCVSDFAERILAGAKRDGNAPIHDFPTSSNRAWRRWAAILASVRSRHEMIVSSLDVVRT